MPTTGSSKSAAQACRELDFLNWLYDPFHGFDASAVYDLLSTDSATERGLYLNLDYWREAANIDEASEALALLVAKTARIGRADRVLDCGFGFGDQDILWATTVTPKRIIGLNITGSQVAVARQRISELGLDDRVDLRRGSATEMPVDTDSIDVVTALECAFHFRTRQRFFHEAWRVLQPGGRLVTADIIPMPAAAGLRESVEQRISWGLVAGKFAIPAENAYTRATYVSRLRHAGFQRIEVTSIRDQVYAPLHRHLADHPDVVRRLHPMTRPPVKFALRFDPTSVYRGLDYVLASAVKPS